MTELLDGSWVRIAGKQSIVPKRIERACPLRVVDPETTSDIGHRIDCRLRSAEDQRDRCWHTAPEPDIAWRRTNRAAIDIATAIT